MEIGGTEVSRPVRNAFLLAYNQINKRTGTLLLARRNS
jgi:hypothetical protein